MSYNPQNPNGSATSANSAPVVIASDQTAVPVSATSLPLPSTAATSTKQSDGTQKTQIVDGSGNVIASTSNALNVGPSTATGSAVPANAHYIGGLAKTSLPTAASDGNLTGLMTDKFGRPVILVNAQRDLVLPITQLTVIGITETTLIAQVASTFLDIVSLVVINSSGIPVQADFRDSTGGTIRLSLYIPASDTRGIALPVPLPQNAVNNNWTVKLSSAAQSVIITGSYIKNQ